MSATEEEQPRPSAEIVAATVEIKQRAEEAKLRKEGKQTGKKDKEEEDDLRANLTMDEHQIDLEELYTRYGTNPTTGLTKAQVQNKQEVDGFNRLTPPKEKSELRKLLETQLGFFNLLLWAGAILCLIGYILQKSVDNLYLCVVLSGVVTITGIFEYFQEKKSSDLMASFAGMLPPKATVLRDGEFTKIESHEVCQGDIIKIQAGNKIPADIRVVKCSEDMKVEQAALTGEPDHLSRKVECTDENPLETKNLLFFGTLCPSGNSTGIVVNIGDRTVMGRISKIATQTENVQTPINKEIQRFVLIVSAVAVFLGVTFFIIGVAKKTDPITNLVFMIGIIVANVPEGLLATVTVCLSLTAQRMYTKNVLVKNLESVETLGSTSCICSDKTGTLTINKMTVANICVDQAIYETKDGRTQAKAYDLLDYGDDSVRRLVRCGTSCNNATFDAASKQEERDDPSRGVKEGDAIPFRVEETLADGSTQSMIKWTPIGDASESAMIKFTQEAPLFDDRAYEVAGVEREADGEAGPGIAKAREAFPKIETEADGTAKTWEIKFNSRNKYQVSVHKQYNDDSKPALLLMKGAPERILSRCDYVMHKGERIELTDEIRQKYEDLNLELAKMGRRVLAFCEQELDQEKFPATWEGYSTEPTNFPIGNDEDEVKENLSNAKDPSVVEGLDTCGKLTYIGMMALIDPPRKQVPGAVEKCKSAGIKVVMVTGDHPATAHAIAKEVNIIWGKTSKEMKEENVKNGLPEEGDGTDKTDPDFAPAIVVAGWEFDHRTAKSVWDDMLIHGQVVFARTSPQQKLIIVENFQARGHVVAVTGDGVNDAPALKKADIGVAMGIMGSDVSKEAADMILLDDNFASIVAGVEEGRLIFDNLKKSIAYTLSSNIPEISPFLAFITIQVPLPLSTILILCVDLGTDMVPAISMAWENAEADIMSRNPRNAATDHLVTMKLVCFAYLQIGVIQATAGFYSWMTVLNDYGYKPFTLPTLGAYDNWGKQPLYCLLEGGVLRNENGEWFKSLVQDSSDYSKFDYVDKMQAFSEGYIFWDDDISDLSADNVIAGVNVGEVKECHFAAKNILGEALEADWNGGSYNSWTKFVSEGIFGLSTSSESGFTAGYKIVSAQSIVAMQEQGFIQYIPFKARMSPFYDTNWLKWDSSVRGSGLGVYGMGSDMLNSVHFQSFPIGLHVLSGKSATYGSTEAYLDVSVGAQNVLDKLSLTLNGVTKDKMTSSVFKTASVVLPGYGVGGLNVSGATDVPKFVTIGQDTVTVANTVTKDTAASSLPSSMYSWYDASAKKTYFNVANRMMQAEALAHAQCSGFICIIVVQWADLMICKTRWLSIRQQGMVNPIMNFGLLFETLLGVFLCYVPGVGDVLGTRPLRFTHWFPGMPFCLFIFTYDEIRKMLMRKTSKKIRDKHTKRYTNMPGWLERNTYY